MLYASSYALLDPRLEIRRAQWVAFTEPAAAALLGGNAGAVFVLASEPDEPSVDEQ